MIPDVTYHSRGEWESAHYPVTGPTMRFDELDTLALHYTAAPDVPDGDNPDTVGAYLAATQRDYVTNRGYSIGYNFAVDQTGAVWQLRGLGFKCAANRGWNHRTVAVLCLVDGADPLTDPALESVRKVLSFCQHATGRTLKPRPHSEIGATACPGDGVRSQLPLITPWIDVTPVPPPEEHDMGTAMRWKHPDYRDQFLVGVGGIERITPLMAATLNARGLTDVIVEADANKLAECVAETGITHADLTPS